MSINHGANLFDLSNKLNLNEDELLDFSSNINPFGASKNAKEAIKNNIKKVSMYPDPEYTELKKSIANYCNCETGNIVLGSGATELISSFISIVNHKSALLISPAYSEYEKELTKINCSITKYYSKKEDDFKINVDDLISTINQNSFDLIVICNPNNPTGFAFTKLEIEKILQSTNCMTMVDETYVEFTNTDIFSCTPLVDDYKNIFVIRGTSKFFSTPGIRLGYGLLQNGEIKNSLLKKIDLWNINIFADIMGTIMFVDNEFIKTTQKYMEDERTYLSTALKEIASIKVYDSFGNFILCEITKKKLTAKELYDKLLPLGIIIRNCKSFDGLDEYFFRVCALKPSENKLLISKLKEIL